MNRIKLSGLDLTKHHSHV